MHVPGKNSQTPLMETKDPNIAKLLIVDKEGLDLKDQDGNTALHIATKEGRQEIVNIILDAGFPVDFPGQNGQTALMLATTLSLAELLLSRGAS